MRPSVDRLLLPYRVGEIGAAGLCSFVHDSPAVHLTSTCLPNYASRLTTPVLSVQSGGGTHPHVSFMASERDGSELPVLLDAARMMKWKSAVYVGDTTTGQRSHLHLRQTIEL